MAYVQILYLFYLKCSMKSHTVYKENNLGRYSYRAAFVTLLILVNSNLGAGSESGDNNFWRVIYITLTTVYVISGTDNTGALPAKHSEVVIR